MNDRLVFEMGAAEQNGHNFGWQFGNYQLRGANAIREELLPDEEPLPNPLWPEEMEQSAIFFGGTDPGRFVPTYMIYSAKVRPDVYLITQNALADDTYMSVERDLYGDEIWIPSKEDSAQGFGKYVDEVQSGKRPANGDLRIENGRVQVTGALGVMEINGILTQAMFEHERQRHAFYIEESYVIRWMYDYLSPHGLIMKINKDKNPLNDSIVRNDMEFWDWYMRRLLLDPAFRRDFPAQKSFSKLRAAIAGLYANERYRARTNADMEKYTSLAAQSFREAVALYPASPEATFRYIQEVLGTFDKWDAVLDMVNYTDKVDPNNSRTKDIKKNAEMARNAKAVIDEILPRIYKKGKVDTTSLSNDDINRLADASLEYAEANLMFNPNNTLQSANLILNIPENGQRPKSFDRLWRSAIVFQKLGCYYHDSRVKVPCDRYAALFMREALKLLTADSYEKRDTALQIFLNSDMKDDCADAYRRLCGFHAAEKFDVQLKYAVAFLRRGYADLAADALDEAAKYAGSAKVEEVLSMFKMKMQLASRHKTDAWRINREVSKAVDDTLSMLETRTGHRDTTWSDIRLMADFYWEVWNAARKGMIVPKTNLDEVIGKALSCYSQYASAMNTPDAYLELAKRHEMSMQKDSKKTQKEARRNAVKACIRLARQCVFSKDPRLDVARSYLDKAREIDPEYVNLITITGTRLLQEPR